MNYNKTTNLPHTNFPMRAQLAQREPQFLSLWEKTDVYHKLLERNKNGKKFILHDGPPYANGHIHLGHAFNRTLKDIVIKYRALCGSCAPFIPGWDCHGLPIEYQLLKETGQKPAETDEDILKFRAEARKYASRFVDIQRKEFLRLGLIGEWEHPYVTMAQEYEADIVDCFRRLAKSGYIIRRKKPVFWCPNCQTALAEAEVEYADAESPSIDVFFPAESLRNFVKDIEQDISIGLAVWTTTPWTLPANVAVAVHPDLKYQFVRYENHILVVSGDCRQKLESRMQQKSGKVIKEINGQELTGCLIRHPFIDKEVPIIAAAFVTSEEGTGIVHIAPGHGEDDYHAGLKYSLPMLVPVNEKGQFVSTVENWAGMNVFDADTVIVKYLNEKGLLLAQENITHSYPHCWRCKQKVIFRATPQWFLDIEKENLRGRLIHAVRNVKWIPEICQSRILGMLETRPDWCLSRQRVWGVPVPVVYCSECGIPAMTDEIMSNFRDLIRKENSDVWYKVPVEKLVPEGYTCTNCGNKSFQKGRDILDVWFDSGVSHQVVLRSNPDLGFPSDMYLEGSDQHRGWFQTSLISAVALEQDAPYRAVLTHGFVVDGDGRKMSKSLGNVIDPSEIVNKLGADVLRLWVSSEDYRLDVRISNEILSQIQDAYRKFRNSFRFILGNLYDFSYDEKLSEQLREIDKYTLVRLAELRSRATQAYEAYEFHRVYRLLYDYCTCDLSQFYFDILKDRLYCSAPDWQERKLAQYVLFNILKQLAVIASPILSFTCEECWQQLRESHLVKEESVFLVQWPESQLSESDNELLSRWKKIFTIRDTVMLALEKSRKKKEIGSSLEANVAVFAEEPEWFELLKSLSMDEWKEILIVSQFSLVSEPLSENTIQTDNPKIQVHVRHADGAKCARCWNWSESVGTDQEHPTLCARCLKVVRG